MQMSSPRPASIVAKPGMNRLSSRMTRMADLMTRSQGRSLPCPLLTGSARPSLIRRSDQVSRSHQNRKAQGAI